MNMHSKKLPRSRNEPLAQPHEGGGSYYAAPGGSPHPSVPDPSSREAAPSSRFSPARIFGLIRRKWMLITVSILLALTFGYYITQSEIPQYNSFSVIQLHLRRPRIMNNQEAIINEGGKGKAAHNIYLRKIQGEVYLSKTLERFKNQFKDTEDLLDKLQMYPLYADIRMEYDAPLIRISVTHQNAEWTAVYANAYAEIISEMIMDENRASSDKAVEWLETQRENKRLELEAVDKEVLKFRQARSVGNLERDRSILEQLLSSLNLQRIELEKKRALEKEVFEFLSSAELTSDTVQQLPSAVAKAEAIRASIENLATAYKRRRALLVRYTKKHPEVIAENELIVALNEEFKVAIPKAKKEAEANVSLIEQQIENVIKKQQGQSAKLEELNLSYIQINTKLKALERGREAVEFSYRGILTRIEEARLAADESTARVEVITHASTPLRPLALNGLRVWYMALFWGGFIGLGLAFIIDILEDFIWNAQDIELDLGLSVLGLIPHITDAERANVARYCHENKQTLVAEAFAGVRGVLTSGHYKGRTKVLMVTSSAPKEGKTICSTNLSIMYANSGLKTLLIDLDLRIPRIQGIFNLDKTINLATALVSKEPVDFAQVVQTTPVEHLDVMCSRPERNISPVDIMGSRALQELIAWAEQHYDQVIIDTPPFGAVNDSIVIGGMVDGVVLVGRERKSRKGPIRRAIQQFEGAGANVLGIIMNDLKVKKGRYGYYSSYSYNHTYYSDYTQVAEEEFEGPSA